MSEKQEARTVAKPLMAQTITAFRDMRGGLHATERDACYASAYAIFCEAVEEHTAQGEFMVEQFLDELRKKQDLRDALYVLSITGE